MRKKTEPTKSPPKLRSIPPRTYRDELQEMALGFRTPFFAQDVWDNYFTPEDRAKLNGDLEMAYADAGWYGVIGMWSKAKNVSVDRAVIELSGVYGVPQAKLNSLLLAIGEKVKPEPNDRSSKRSTRAQKPKWDRYRGLLQLNDTVIRTVRGGTVATNIVLILDAFQANGWPSGIRNPLPPPQDTHRLHKSVRTLNTKLRAIRFHVAESGTIVSWSRT